MDARRPQGDFQVYADKRAAGSLLSALDNRHGRRTGGAPFGAPRIYRFVLARWPPIGLRGVLERDKLFLIYKRQRLQFEAGGGGFLPRHPDLDRFPVIFGRTQGEKGKVIEVSHGSDWYVNKLYADPRNFTYPKTWDAFTGHYRNDSPWMGSFRVVNRKGKLWLDGTLPLEPVDANTFRLADSAYNPEWIRFLDVVEGEAMHLKFSGEDYLRVDAA